MEQNPAPVNLSALKNILAKSKQVMNKVENISPSAPKNTQRVNESQYSNVGYDEKDEREPEYQQYSPSSEPAPLQNFSREHIMASNLPQNVKEAMINKPIAKVSMANTSFSLEDVQDINPRTQPQRQVVNEGRPAQVSNSDLITISRGELKEIMNETLVNFLKSSYEKSLTEAAITKTINLLIKEGKIGVKKKTL